MPTSNPWSHIPNEVLQYMTRCHVPHASSGQSGAYELPFVSKAICYNDNGTDPVLAQLWFIGQEDPVSLYLFPGVLYPYAVWKVDDDGEQVAFFS